MTSQDVRAMISGLIQLDVQSRTDQNYRTSWAEASGGSPDEAPEPATNVGREFFVKTGHDRGYGFGWTFRKDRQGVWWSFRSFQRSHLCALEFDEWEAHKQRQAAKARAKANASLHRKKEPEALKKLLP